MRLSASLLLAAVAVPFSVAAAAFPDVPPSHENYDAIEYMKAHAIVDGYPDGSYRPMQGINRGEFTKIIMNALFDPQEIAGCPARNPGRWFTDVGGDEWFAPYVCFAKEKGIVSGLPDGSFHPGSALVFTEANKILANSFGLTAPDAPAVAGGIWYKSYVEALAAKNAIPRTVKKFSDPIRRGEIAEMAYRLKENITDKPSLTYGELAGEGAVSLSMSTSSATTAGQSSKRMIGSTQECEASKQELLQSKQVTDEDSTARGLRCSEFNPQFLALQMTAEMRYRKFCQIPKDIDAANDPALSDAFYSAGNTKTACAALAAFGKVRSTAEGGDPRMRRIHQELVLRGCLSMEQILEQYSAEYQELATYERVTIEAYLAVGDPAAEQAAREAYVDFITDHTDYRCYGV